MKLEEFIDFLAIAEGLHNRLDRENELYEELFEDFYGFNRGVIKALDLLVDTLDLHMGGGGMVSWWSCDCEFGKVPLSASVGDEPLELIDSTEKLYDFIVRSNAENSKDI